MPFDPFKRMRRNSSRGSINPNGASAAPSPAGSSTHSFASFVGSAGRSRRHSVVVDPDGTVHPEPQLGLFGRVFRSSDSINSASSSRQSSNPIPTPVIETRSSSTAHQLPPISQLPPMDPLALRPRPSLESLPSSVRTATGYTSVFGSVPNGQQERPLSYPGPPSPRAVPTYVKQQRPVSMAGLPMSPPPAPAGGRPVSMFTPSSSGHQRTHSGPQNRPLSGSGFVPPSGVRNSNQHPQYRRPTSMINDALRGPTAPAPRPESNHRRSYAHARMPSYPNIPSAPLPLPAAPAVPPPRARIPSYASPPPPSADTGNPAYKSLRILFEHAEARHELFAARSRARTEWAKTYAERLSIRLWHRDQDAAEMLKSKEYVYETNLLALNAELVKLQGELVFEEAPPTMQEIRAEMKKKQEKMERERDARDAREKARRELELERAKEEAKVDAETVQQPEVHTDTGAEAQTDAADAVTEHLQDLTLDSATAAQTASSVSSSADSVVSNLQDLTISDAATPTDASETKPESTESTVVAEPTATTEANETDPVDEMYTSAMFDFLETEEAPPVGLTVPARPAVTDVAEKKTEKNKEPKEEKETHEAEMYTQELFEFLET
ncbi:hypothetical protein EDC01DRAFT_785844 [Geopyxis carbonaria]|nr:hypothetical protein EDC01DRAFT_785844 [Geopyxis carbonaria]